MHPQYTPSDIQRFWAKTQAVGECVEWQAYRFPNGYGKFFAQQHHRYAHRFAYEITYGPIGEGMNVCHRCDNPACVNPAHLFLGTQADNLRDMAAKGRSTSGDRNPSRLYPERRAKGEGHGCVKLTVDDVIAIRDRAAAGETCTVLARAFGISHAQVRRIIRRERWAHI